MRLRCVPQFPSASRSTDDRIQGFIQFDVTEETEAGKVGATSRREKEVRERETRQLTGLEGKSLYLEALQLVLRRQVLWLVREKGHIEELETVVRDLWDLRIRAFGSMVIVPEEADGDGDGAPKLEVFSSQPADDEELSTGMGDGDEQQGISPRSRALNWDHERGPSDWPMPRLIDTLALCYLGCLLLRIPTRVGEILKWTAGGNIPYKRVVSIAILQTRQLPWCSNWYCSTMICRKRCRSVCRQRIFALSSCRSIRPYMVASCMGRSCVLPWDTTTTTK